MHSKKAPYSTQQPLATHYPCNTSSQPNVYRNLINPPSRENFDLQNSLFQQVRLILSVYCQKLVQIRSVYLASVIKHVCTYAAAKSGVLRLLLSCCSISIVLPQIRSNSLTSLERMVEQHTILQLYKGTSDQQISMSKKGQTRKHYSSPLLRYIEVLHIPTLPRQSLLTLENQLPRPPTSPSPRQLPHLSRTI